MTANLHQLSGFGSGWTAQSKYIIDFQRGLVTHSKTLTKGQFNRWITVGVAARRPDLNPRQAFNYYTKYLTGQKFMLLLKKTHNNEIQKLSFQASISYAQNHKDVFEKLENQFVYPIVQMPYGGFVRSRLERDNIVKYVEKIIEKANFYGMHLWQKKNDKQTVRRTYDSLRSIAFKPRGTEVQSPSQSNDQ